MVLLNFKLTQLLHVYSQLLKNSLLHILLKLISKAQQQERGNIAIYVTIVHYRIHKAYISSTTYGQIESESEETS